LERENDIVRRKESVSTRGSQQSVQVGVILTQAISCLRHSARQGNPRAYGTRHPPSSALRNRYHTGTHPRTSAKKREKQSQCRSERARRADARAANSPPPKRSPLGASATNGRKRGETLDCQDSPAAPSQKEHSGSGFGTVCSRTLLLLWKSSHFVTKTMRHAASCARCPFPLCFESFNPQCCREKEKPYNTANPLAARAYTDGRRGVETAGIFRSTRLKSKVHVRQRHNQSIRTFALSAPTASEIRSDVQPPENHQASLETHAQVDMSIHGASSRPTASPSAPRGRLCRQVRLHV